VVVEDDREDAGQRQLEEERCQRRQRDGGIKQGPVLRPGKWQLFSVEDRRVQVRKILQQKVRRAGFEFTGGGDTGSDGNGTDAVFFGRDYVLGSVADQRYGADRSLAAGAFDGEPGQSAAGGSHFSEGAELKVVIQAGAFELAPAYAGEIAGYQSEDGSAGLQGGQQGFDAGTLLVAEVGDSLLINVLRCLDDRRHGGGDLGRVETHFGQHLRQDVGVEHAVYGDSVSGGFDAGNETNGVDERLAVVGSGATDEGAVDIEEVGQTPIYNDRSGQRPIYTMTDRDNARSTQ
jgi:hypothetical protein